MQKTIHPSGIMGSLAAPPSKSYMQRALAMASLCSTETIILNASFCEDALAGIQVLKGLGFGVNIHKNEIRITPKSTAIKKQLNFGESGLALRLFTPILGLQNIEFLLTAEGSLLSRPQDFMGETLEKTQVAFESKGGFPPLKVHGPMQGGQLTMDGSLSSQFLSGMLMALPLTRENSSIQVKNLMSKPYVAMTLETIKAFSGEIQSNEHLDKFIIQGNQKYQAKSYRIEGDWSGAASLLVAGALGGEIRVEQLQTNSSQADLKILNALESVGCSLELTSNSVKVVKPKALKAFDFDALHCPDLFPVLTALAASCKGTSKIHGVHRLKHKESDRAAALIKEFSKLGIACHVSDDSLWVTGGEISGAEVEGHNDHRIAMALALAALNANGPVRISGAECINKTYPDFYLHMQKLGVKID